MSTKSAPYYWLECDGCGVKSTENSDYTAWSNAHDALDSAVDSDWIHGEHGDFCWDCQVTPCRECGAKISDNNQLCDPDVLDSCASCHADCDCVRAP